MRSLGIRRRFARGPHPVTIIVPTLGASQMTATAVASIHATTDRESTHVIVIDDFGPPKERDAMHGLDGVELILGECNLGFAGNVNRAMGREGRGDVVLFNNDVVAHDGWLDELKHAAYSDAQIGIVGPMLLYPNETIQSAGTIRNPDQPQWFDHRFRWCPADHAPANVPTDVLATTGACLYVKREVIKRIGVLDADYPMAFEDTDYCLRAWQAGFRVRYCPSARLTHPELTTRGKESGERERRSLEVFWQKWSGWFESHQELDDAVMAPLLLGAEA